MKDARPWTGFFVGLLLGIAVAVILQQAGVWPLDQLLLFGLAGIFGLIGILLGRLGRESIGAFSSYVPLVLAFALIAYGALGLADLNEVGELNGGCRVQAQSDVDSTMVTDTSRGDPFDIDPDGGLDWAAMSPGAIMDHTWKIHVQVGGFNVPIASGGDPNEGGSTINEDQIDDLTSYIQTVTFATGQELRGTFIVGGDISVQSGVVCDGFGFVRLTSDNPFESLVSKIATGLALLALLILLTLLLRRSKDGAESEEAVAEAAPERAADEVEGAAAARGLAGTAGGDEDDSSGDEPGAEDLPNRDDLA